jgi:hypothetical protein
MALDNHAEGVTDEQAVDARLIEQLRGWKIVCREHSDTITAAFHRQQGTNGD